MNGTQKVSLVFDQAALKKSLRFAFADRLKVLQELLQNARRAGATEVSVVLEGDDERNATLTVLDDGSGIEDFQVMLSVGTSGWDGSVASTEKPYGMGFLSCLYACKEVEIVSRGRVLKFDTDAALGNYSFDVNGYMEEPPPRATTWVKLKGFDATGLKTAIASMAEGFAIPIVFNGEKLQRPDAEDASFTKTAVGQIRIQGHEYERGLVRVFLQGFQVYKQERFWRGRVDTIHLDSSKFHGKFPDRDRVIDEKEMLALVDAEVRALYVEKLLAMKRKLEPAVFASHCHSLARSLGMLEVFNDIDVVPADWLRRIQAMPHEAFEGDEFLGDEDDDIQRQQLTQKEVVLVRLDTYGVGQTPGLEAAWLMAHAADAKVLRAQVHDDHWVNDMLLLDDQAEDLEGLVSVSAGKALKTAELTDGRLQVLFRPKVVICDHVVVEGLGERIELKEPVGDSESNTVFVPLGEQGKPMYVESCVLQQLASYEEDERSLDDELERDCDALNQMIRELASNSEEERIALALEAALRHYQDVRSISFKAVVDDKGRVEVSQIKR